MQTSKGARYGDTMICTGGKMQVCEDSRTHSEGVEKSGFYRVISAVATEARSDRAECIFDFSSIAHCIDYEFHSID